MRPIYVIAGLALLAAVVFTAPTSAQPVEPDSASVPSDPQSSSSDNDDGESEERFQPRTMEEIEVVVDPWGRPRTDLEMMRQEQMIESIFSEMRMREREEEDIAWRQSDPDLENSESRIKWGYSPQAEQRMRRESDYLYDSGTELAKPASIFRIEF